MERRPRGTAQCRVCQHREHAAIDLGMARGVSIRALSRRYKVSIDSLYRHQKNHLPPQLRAKLIAGPNIEGVDLELLRSNESQSLLMHLVSLRNRLFAALDFAEANGDNITRIASQLHSNFELVAKLLGDLNTGSINTTNILIAPQYIEMRLALVKALEPYPQARTAVAAVLHKLESQSAEVIEAEAKEGLAR